MKTLNDYTFISWNNGASKNIGTSKDIEFTVQAETFEEAHKNVYDVCRELGLSYNVELVKSSTPLVWEVWACDIDNMPGVDWAIQCVAYTQDEAEYSIELELSERRVSYAVLEARAIQEVPKEVLETGIIRLSDMDKEVK